MEAIAVNKTDARPEEGIGSDVEILGRKRRSHRGGTHRRFTWAAEQHAENGHFPSEVESKTHRRN